VIRLTRAECGDRVFDALWPSAGMTLAGLVVATGMTASQVRRGLDYIKDFLAEAKAEPLIYENGLYKFALTERQAAIYARRRLQIAQTQLRRLRSRCIAPSKEKFGKHRSFEYIEYDFDRLETDLSMAIDHIGRIS
jgi:hypothetical protein